MPGPAPMLRNVFMARFLSTFRCSHVGPTGSADNRLQAALVSRARSPSGRGHRRAPFLTSQAQLTCRAGDHDRPATGNQRNPKELSHNGNIKRRRPCHLEKARCFGSSAFRCRSYFCLHCSCITESSRCGLARTSTCPRSDWTGQTYLDAKALPAGARRNAEIDRALACEALAHSRDSLQLGRFE